MCYWLFRGPWKKDLPSDPILDYKPSSNSGSNNHEGRVNATFLGHALVRGYKSFLDIKQPDWREYVDDTLQDDNNDNMVFKTVNPAVIPTGCDEHANRYAIYAVDSRQALVALAGEPRFLSIAPDMGLASLTAADDMTSPSIKALARTYIQQQKNTNHNNTMTLDKIAFLTVTSTWFQTSSFVENGIIREDEQDGIITDYPESIGIWSRQVFHSHDDEPSLRYPEGCGSNPAGGSVINVTTALEYRRCIDAAIRAQEKLSATNTMHDNETMSGRDFGSFDCQKPARYGTDKHTARFNKIMTACELEDLMIRAGIVQDNSVEGKVRPEYPLVGCSIQPESSSSIPAVLVHGSWNLSSETISTMGVFLVVFALGVFAGTKISSRKNESSGKQKSKTE